MINVLVVEDSEFMIGLISRIIDEQDDMRIAGSAKSGEEAVGKILELQPDCVTMDINMPGKMNGVDAVRAIMTSNPVSIIMLSAYSSPDARLTLQALEYGAVDFVQKPSGEISSDLASVKNELISKIRATAHVKPRKTTSLPKERPERKRPEVRFEDHAIARSAIAIGVSTGGPRLLREILPLFRKDTRAAALVALHINYQYVDMLIEQLAAETRMPIVEAADMMDVREGIIYISPGNYDMVVENRKIILQRPPEDAIWYPSIDRLFESVAKTYPGRCSAVVLTGLGDDGSKGIEKIKKRRGYVIAQEESSCVVAGMSKSAVGTGLVDKILPPRLIPVEIQKWLNRTN